MPFPLPTWLEAVHHDGSANYVSDLTPQLNDTVTIRLRTSRDAPLRHVLLRTTPDGEEHLAVMISAEITPVCQWWQIELTIREPIVNYRFVLLADDGVWFYSAAGPSHYVPLDNTDFRILANHTVPAWLETAVFYQIFPERFANGDPSNDPGPDSAEYQGKAAKTFAWGKPPDPDQPFPITFYGGDLNGIVEHLDYLQELGVNTLYLNPIFTAESNHKYDVTNYREVDPHFGGNEALIALRQALTERNMRYVLDIVPNHCGYWHPWFQKALTDPDSEEAGYFTFYDHPDDYESWLGVWTLPKLNYTNQAVRDEIYEGDSAVFRHWLQPPYSADGWRVDVANMLARQGPSQQNAEIIRGIRQAVKSVEPQAYLMGETFFDGSGMMQGDQWDGVMNYMGLTLPFWHWLRGYKQWVHGLKQHTTSPVKWSTAALIDSWQQSRAAIPWVLALQQYNLLDSHDTPRIRTVVGENDDLHRLALIVLLTFPGVPGLYYGDEVGMVDDPVLAQRGCMPWNSAEWNHDLLTFHKQLIALRKESEALRRGGFEVLLAEDDTFVYQRESIHDRMLVIAHRDETPRPSALIPVAHGGISDGTTFANVFTSETAVVENGMLDLGRVGQGGAIWRQQP